jgi:hypothetical protein
VRIALAMLILVATVRAEACPMDEATPITRVSPDHLVLPINPTLYVYGDVADVVMVRDHELVPYVATRLGSITRLDVIAGPGLLTVATFRANRDRPHTVHYHVTDRATSHAVRLHGIERVDEASEAMALDGEQSQRIVGYALSLASDAVVWRIAWADGEVRYFGSHNERGESIEHAHAVEQLHAIRESEMGFELTALFDDGAEVLVLRVEDGEITRRGDFLDEPREDRTTVLASLFALGLLLGRRQARGVA